MKNKKTKRVIVFGILILTALFAAELFFIHSSHAETWWQSLKGFHLLLGFFGGLALMLFAKALGIFCLYRKEDYYD